jgi:glutamyl-tRNA reductase
MIELTTYDNNYFLSERENYLKTEIELSVKEGVLIKTCNRIEIYNGDEEIKESISNHLFRVVSGLESSHVGEIAIQVQVKSAYIEASQKYNLSKSLHLLFQTALFEGKRARTESMISKGAMFHNLVAVNIIYQSGINLRTAVIIIIGAHKLNEDIIKFLCSKGAELIFLGNKSFEKSHFIANQCGCSVLKLEHLKYYLNNADILISATSAPHLIVKQEDVNVNKSMLVIDLAFPKDVDDRLRDNKNARLYNLEDVERIVEQNIDKRRNKKHYCKTAKECRIY